MIYKLLRLKYISPPLTIFLFSLLVDITVQAQDIDRVKEFCSDTQIKTILLHRTGWDLSMPVIYINENETLSLHFDYLGKPSSDYSFSLTSCTFDWEINDISDHHYMEGFNDVPIYDYYPSRNTTRYFTHFQAEIPNEEIRVLKSGNYLLKVYDSVDPEKVVFTRKLCFAERLTDVSARIKYPDDIHQEIMLQINLSELELINPLAEIRVVVIKNYNWNDPIRISSPPLLRDNVLFMDMPFQIVADGGNEYRYFDTKSTKFISERVDYIDYQAPEFHFFLKPDKLNQYDPYFTSTDLNGRFFVEIPDAHDRHTESDYVNVHFKLEAEQPFDADVYVYGALTGWETNESNYMMFDYNKKVYTKSLLLKQGYYNYSYVMKNFNKPDLRFDITEGNHSETENDYLVFVYLRQNMSDFDRLVGYTVVNSLGDNR